ISCSIGTSFGIGTEDAILMSVTSHHSDSIHTLARNGRIPYSRVLRGPHLSDALKLLGSAWLETLGLTIVLVRVVIRSQARRMVTFYFAHNPVLLSGGSPSPRGRRGRDPHIRALTSRLPTDVS